MIRIIMNHVLIHVSNLVQLSGATHVLFISQLQSRRDLSGTDIKFLS